jgi:hypothetical protein
MARHQQICANRKSRAMFRIVPLKLLSNGAVAGMIDSIARAGSYVSGSRIAMEQQHFIEYSSALGGKG